MNPKEFEGKLVELVKSAVVDLPEDIKNAIQNAYDKETNEIAKTQLEVILKNINIASKKRLPLCQDTGFPIFFVKVGVEYKLPPDFKNILKRSVETAVKEVPMRPNVVSAFDRKNSGTNTGFGYPIIEYDLVEGNSLEITFVPKGGGSENGSALLMLNPNDSIETVKERILEKIREFGGKTCPPYILGIGMGGSSDICMKLAKKAAIRSIGSKTGTKEGEKLEKELLALVNGTNIGTMGLGGDTTALAVHVEAQGNHVATNCVGINTLCWCARRKTINFEG